MLSNVIAGYCQVSLKRHTQNGLFIKQFCNKKCFIHVIQKTSQFISTHLRQSILNYPSFIFHLIAINVHQFKLYLVSRDIHYNIITHPSIKVADRTHLYTSVADHTKRVCL